MYKNNRRKLRSVEIFAISLMLVNEEVKHDYKYVDYDYDDYADLKYKSDSEIRESVSNVFFADLIYKLLNEAKDPIIRSELQPIIDHQKSPGHRPVPAGRRGPGHDRQRPGPGRPVWLHHPQHPPLQCDDLRTGRPAAHQAVPDEGRRNHRPRFRSCGRNGVCVLPRCFRDHLLGGSRKRLRSKSLPQR